MDKKNILKEIKSLIFSTTEEVEEKTFKDVKVGDYILRIEADEFVEGLQVMIVTEDGVIPAGPELAGEHVLEDGTKLTLDENGVIVKVEMVEAPTEVVAEMPTEEMAEEEEEMVEHPEEEEEMGGMEKRMSDMEKKIEEMEKFIDEMLSATKDTANFSSVVMEKLDNFIKDTPAQLEFKSIKSQYKSDVKRNNETKIDRLESIKNLRMKK